MKTLLLDMDGVLVDFVPHWLNYLNLFSGIDIRPEQVTKYALHECDIAQGYTSKSLYSPFQTPGFFRTAPMMPGAREFIRELNLLQEATKDSEDPFEFFIVTHPSGPDSAKEKIEWVNGAFGPDINIIMTKHKYLVKGDILVDDCIEYVVKFLRHQPGSRALIPTTSYIAHELEKHWLPIMGPNHRILYDPTVRGHNVLCDSLFFNEVLAEAKALVYK